ncbi:hypothetical protein RJT34_16770 [Clitoria ternatea]|uniref:Uncharacterized protein n=1 Tax=Clitoria ternatea TaxID=43366 RepID=A0AAN9J9U5_CLITE
MASIVKQPIRTYSLGSRPCFSLRNLELERIWPIEALSRSELYFARNTSLGPKPLGSAFLGDISLGVSLKLESLPERDSFLVRPFPCLKCYLFQNTPLGKALPDKCSSEVQSFFIQNQLTQETSTQKQFFPEKALVPKSDSLQSVMLHSDVYLWAVFIQSQPFFTRNGFDQESSTRIYLQLGNIHSKSTIFHLEAPPSGIFHSETPYPEIIHSATLHSETPYSEMIIPSYPTRK